MPIREQLANNEIYHVLNRGVEKRDIFMDDPDRFRFIHDLFEFNDKNPALYDFHRKGKYTESRSPTIEIKKVKREKPRELLVEVLAWCLMPNHFHLLLRQLKDNGISLFMKKLGIGYAMYFNEKHERSGVLFQGRFKSVLVKSDAHFAHLPFYIHCNPLDLIEPGWRQGEIKNYQKAIKFLDSYRLSSHIDYTGKKNFPSVSQREFLLKVFNGTAEYKKQYREWLKAMSQEQLETIKIVALEK